VGAGPRRYTKRVANGPRMDAARLDRLCVDTIRTLPMDAVQEQDPEYRARVLPPAVEARVAVERASTFGWDRYAGPAGRIIGMKTFGASAPLKALQRRFGFTPGAVAAAARELLGRRAP